MRMLRIYMRIDENIEPHGHVDLDIKSRAHGEDLDEYKNRIFPLMSNLVREWALEQGVSNEKIHDISYRGVMSSTGAISANIETVGGHKKFIGEVF